MEFVEADVIDLNIAIKDGKFVSMISDDAIVFI